MKTYIGRGHRLVQRDKEIDIAINDADLSGHFWCFGTTRVGKTRMIENIVEQSINKG